MSNDRNGGAGPADDRPGILFVSPVVNMKGGAERVLMQAMANPAIRPVLAVPGPGELAASAREKGIPVHFVRLGAVEKVRRKPTPLDLLRAARAALQCAVQIAAVARAENVAAVQTNGLKVHVAGALARVLTLGRIRLIPHVHDIPYTRLERAIWRGLAATSTRTIIVSPPCMPGPHPARVAIVMNACDKPPAPTARERPPTPPTIGFVGRFHAFKGVHLLLDWFHDMARENPDLRLLLRGRPSDESAAYWASLQPRIASLGDRCQIEGWRDADADAYEGIDILVVPSATPDPCPLVLIEAMAAAIPVIGTPVGGIPAIIGTGEAGRLVGSTSEFAAALRDLLRPETYGRASAAALEKARNSHSLGEFWARFNEEYRLAGVFDGHRGFSGVIAPRVPA
ncbi:glycosyltransferase family 4 protein [Pararoseomonas indoligenes]|uniref:Glycosyltransferase family 4 protein n=1 Tax=Roseomonas indoligenes TaxID=2820811 RepID=A0A940SAD2_9PROT|nr:glycosyltransferase family 4 protein [Pararoseomonas indoligenes]MBP0496243.1 glycosyltransferase family 4 protein [Pararoseomonas indoligenes]